MPFPNSPFSLAIPEHYHASRDRFQRGNKVLRQERRGYSFSTFDFDKSGWSFEELMDQLEDACSNLSLKRTAHNALRAELGMGESVEVRREEQTLKVTLNKPLSQRDAGPQAKRLLIAIKVRLTKCGIF